MAKIQVNHKINIDNFEKEIYNKINISNMQIFTYMEYLKYRKIVMKKLNKYSTRIEDNSEKYVIGSIHHKGRKQNTINNEDDKIFRKMLDIKVEATMFINKKLNTNFDEAQLEKYNSSFITNYLENRESDIVYKIKNKNIFFLIEHQSKKDFKMAWRIIEYSMEIIKSAIDYSKIGKKYYKLPLVIPIVLYTGKGKWDISQYMKEVQEQINECKEMRFGEYAIVDINNLTEEELLKENSYLSKLMLIEKYKKGNDFKEHLQQIINEVSNNSNTYKGKGKDILIITLQNILKDAIGEEKAEEMIKKLKGDDQQMLQIIETLREEREDIKREALKEGKKEGKKQEKLKIIKEMLKRNMPIELIAEITDFSENKIRKITNI